jgi:hypothetical protein
MAWDLTVVAGRFLRTAVLAPLGHGLARLGVVLVLTPARWLHRWVLAPFGRGVVRAARGAWWLLGTVCAGTWAGLWWLLRHAVARPAGWTWRRLLLPLGRGLATAGRALLAGSRWTLRGAWWLAGAGARGIAAAVVRLVRWLLVAPVAGLYRWVLTPVGHALRWLGRGLLAVRDGILDGGVRVVLLLTAAAVWWYRSVLTPLGRAGRWLLVTPATGLHRWLLAPLGRALLAVAAGLGRGALALARGVERFLLAPLGHGLAWSARTTAAGALRLLRGCAAALRGLGAALLWLARGTGRLLGAARARLGWTARAAWRALGVLAAGLGRGARGAWWLTRACGRGVAAAVVWSARWLLVAPASALYRWVLTPLGHGISWAARGVAAGAAWLVRWLVVVPFTAVGRLLAVLAREVGQALGHAWRIAGRISLVVGRFLTRLLRWIFVDPCRWAFRAVFAPAGRFARDAVLRPAGRVVREAGRGVRKALVTARMTVREVRREMRAVLLGSPRAGRAEPAGEARREPTGPGTRTLGSSTTALTKD